MLTYLGTHRGVFGSFLFVSILPKLVVGAPKTGFRGVGHWLYILLVVYLRFYRGGGEEKNF